MAQPRHTHVHTNGKWKMENGKHKPPRKKAAELFHLRKSLSLDDLLAADVDAQSQKRFNLLSAAVMRPKLPFRVVKGVAKGRWVG